MSETRQAIDWQEIYSRLAQTRRHLETSERRSLDEVERILRDRAFVLAQPLPEVQSPRELLDMLVCAIAREQYGIEMAFVLEVIPFRELTPVPCAPPFLLGVVNHRGRILPVLDLRRLLELPGQKDTEAGQIVAVQAVGMTLGISADSMVGTVQVALQDVSLPPVTLTGERHKIVRGVTKEMVAVLDLEALARDPRITVNEEVT
ncbi:MAG: chemotaxis protein CheW [Candidatus Methylomirabilota bacterium]|nr:MAG: chemotaxis protein CheW [candidate division NC10 bacterium]